MAEAKKKKGNTVETVWAMAQPIADRLGLSIWDINYVKEGADWFLRIFIDKEEGISIVDCVDMTHEINPLLDKEDPIPQEYTLEVSSPGLNRKLTRPEHFQQLLEAPVKVRLIRPLENGKRELEGMICRERDDRKCADNTIVTYVNATFYPKQVADVTVGTTSTPQTVYNPLPASNCGCGCGR